MARAAAVRRVGDGCPVEREVAALAERQNGHDALDDSRFGSLAREMSEVKDGLATLTQTVEGVKGDVSEIKVQVAKLQPSPAEPSGHYHIGPGAWAVLIALGTLLAGIVGWLTVQLYDLQPARINQSQHPARVEVVRPAR